MPDQLPIIEVLGSGCKSCHRLHELAQQAADGLQLGITVGYVTDPQRILALGLMSSPVLMVNGQPVLVGFVPDLSRIKEAISIALTPPV
jgi:hypothetical protein